ncbi:hypothetical protein MSAN_01750600 [Mycena sanguinolenta]|uniref:Uncharacterized protein n=1 Tax=Mycena sanguinolenta TaxID=230812 RepID=A0A8H6XTT5_9AGAR|nr:hypothetical protein MSAN_01750600 [Mycena sanguinolenta]
MLGLIPPALRPCILHPSIQPHRHERAFDLISDKLRVCLTRHTFNKGPQFPSQMLATVYSLTSDVSEIITPSYSSFKADAARDAASSASHSRSPIGTLRTLLLFSFLDIAVRYIPRAPPNLSTRADKPKRCFFVGTFIGA